ncbi:MAG TPA: enoyl-CoA hydratase/isomerase family protein [Actinomycetes bacterium]|nr:enoyl-CoA hydratase/isomerase family protein [Actinomycetes bacterium]
MSPSGVVRVERPCPGVVELVIDRPPLNVLDDQCQRELAAALRPLHDEDTLLAVVVRGADDVFSVGADVKELAATTDPDPWGGVELAAHWTRSLETLPCLTIAAIRGHCLGGGLEIALCTDVRIATPEARLGFPEVRLGLLPGMGGTARLPRLVGTSWATRMVMTGEPISAQLGREIGLVTEVATDPRGAALTLADSLRKAGPLAARLAKSLVAQPADEGALRAERLAWKCAWATADHREALAAFLAHRPAHFTGR